MPILLIIIAILFSVLVAIRPLKIGKLTINMSTGSLLALIILIAIHVLDAKTIQLGFLGNGQLRPWEIIVIFFSVAYVSVSADVTGIFDYLAYKIVHKSKGSGYRLFLSIYIFTCLITIFTSNDIDILTLTPIIFYLGKHAKINVVPFLFAQFFSTNIVSMFFYTGNPTNIIVANALDLGFLEYTKIMWLPTVVALIVNFGLLFLFFRKKITKKYSLKKSSHFEVRNWTDAILSSVLLILMLVALGFSEYINMPIWAITLVFALIFIVEDILFSFYYQIKGHHLSVAQQKKAEDIYNIPNQKNEFWIAFKRVPWQILPFIFSLFIFIEGLNQYGLVDQTATFLSSMSHSLMSGILVNGFFSIILANIINNQPMTIFLSNVLISNSFNVSGNIFQGSAYAVVVASNLAASITLLGALAGMMWKKILAVKGLKISYIDFLKPGLFITPIVFIFTLATLYLILK